MSLPNTHPAFDEQEHIIYHTSTSPATETSQAAQNFRACQEMSGYTLPQSPLSVSSASSAVSPLTPSPVVGESWAEGDAPAAEETRGASHSGNVTKCHRMSQKQDFRLIPSVPFASSAVSPLTPSPVVGESRAEGDAPAAEETRGASHSGNVTKCHRMSQKQDFRLIPSVPSASSAVSPLTPSPVVGEG